MDRGVNIAGEGRKSLLFGGVMRSPGEPVNWANLPANQGIGYIWCPGYYGIATPNYPKGIKTPPSLVIVEPARYQTKEYPLTAVPFQQPRTEYRS